MEEGLKKTLKTLYRLVEVKEHKTEYSNQLVFMNSADYHYRSREVEVHIFNTHDEALQYALSSENWTHRDFTVIPVYSFSIDWD
jgi:hypothetical protein